MNSGVVMVFDDASRRPSFRFFHVYIQDDEESYQIQNVINR